ncbi:hypothetical protein F511_35491 [Dorcoceras hygrometricum]|uniref:C3H1-type domain-containing protein n=1 Tax=Dorcoceras hygrometricum TaxID=472368 RepID=A0A2Z7CG66_9LAMI|nr:hypothetical protein F511_35491 [Dorcoceras hygrometricum]
MHSQENFHNQVGQGTYVPPSAFQQRQGGAVSAPSSFPPLTFHQHPPGSQTQAIRQAHPTFPRAPGSLSFIRTPPGAPHQGPVAYVLPNAMNSGQSYLTHQPPSPLQGSTETSHSYLASELQQFPWSQSTPQISPTVPIPASRAYLLPNLQGCGGPPLQPSSHHAPRPPPPSYLSSSSSLIIDPLTTSTNPVSQHLHSVGPLLPHPLSHPPPPPPPPLPPSPPPGAPPLPPSSPPNLSRNDGVLDLKEDSTYEYDSTFKDHPSPVKLAKDRNANDVDVIFHSTETVSVREATDVASAFSPSDSDMDMEDDITQPDVEKSCLSRDLNEECLPVPQDDFRDESVQVTQHPEGRRHSEVILDGSLLHAGSSVLGPEIPSSSDQPGIGDAISEFNYSAPTATGVNDLDVSAQLSSSQHANSSQFNVPVASADAIGGKPSNQLMGPASPFKLLQGYETDNSSENCVRSPRGDIGHSKFEIEKRDDFVSELESYKNLASKSTVVSFAPEKTKEFSDRNVRNQESVRVGTDVEDAYIQKPTMGSNDAKLNVDEFGRLVREGVSDSDTSHSPRYTWRHGRRGRKQNRSQSRSRSPRDRRRRSPLRRKERRRQSPRCESDLICLLRDYKVGADRRFSWRGIEFDGDKLRRGKGQFPECFDFLRGKCYRGATCRYSHHESGKSEKSRNIRGKQQYQDTPPALGDYNLHPQKFPEEKSVLKNKTTNDKELTLLEETHGVKEAKNRKQVPVDSVSQKHDPLLGLNSNHVYGHKIGSVNLPSIVSSSTTSAQLADGFLSRPISKQYDPLLDSIEPALNSFEIAGQQKNGTTGDSYDIQRFKQEEGAVVSANYSPEIEEVGETADAEVGAFVSGSPGNPHITAEMNAGEIEITQVKESGKHKKGKDSRSMKLFKVSIATFVKDVLKPSWRQGNMSKEAFKTIVKKTVDKVSSAMKSHRIPKSQARINHYIDSSRGKLTKLIMGYVDKYVKA